MSYVGWTYEIDAEAELMYTNADPTNWLVEHRWKWEDDHPFIKYLGRGGVRDFFTDFRFSKVLELSDANTEHHIDVSCRVRDVRFANFDFWLEDADVVGYLIGGVSYHPADLACVKLHDVVMFEPASKSEFALFYEMGAAKYGGSFSVRVYPDPSLKAMDFANVIMGRTVTNDHVPISYTFSNLDARIYVDLDGNRLKNKYIGTDNERILRQAIGWTQQHAGKVGVIYDDSLTSGNFSPYDNASADGTRGMLNTLFGELGTGFDLFNHQKISEALANDAIWDNYTLFVYFDRYNRELSYVKLQRLLDRVKAGQAGLIILNGGNNSNTIAYLSTGAEFSAGKHNISAQLIDVSAGSDPQRPIGLNVSALAEPTDLFYASRLEEISDVYLVNPKEIYTVTPSEEISTFGEIRMRIRQNDVRQPERRIYWCEINEKNHLNMTCSRAKAKIEIVDDEVQFEVDRGSISIDHSHFLEDLVMHESFVFDANQWYSWDNSLYTDLSAIHYVYGLTYPNCGWAVRTVVATIRVHNQSKEVLVGTCFDSAFTLAAGSSQEFKKSGSRYEGSGGSGSFGHVTFNSPNEQAWKIDFRFDDYEACPHEPQLPVYCSDDWKIDYALREVPINIGASITKRCIQFTGTLFVRACGVSRNVNLYLDLYNPTAKPCKFTLINRNNEKHEIILPTHGNHAIINMNCPMPLEGDGEPWIAKFVMDSLDGEELPKITTVARVDDEALCFIYDEKVGYCDQLPVWVDQTFHELGYTSSSPSGRTFYLNTTVGDCNNHWRFFQILIHSIPLPNYKPDQQIRVEITVESTCHGYDWKLKRYPRSGTYGGTAPSDPGTYKTIMSGGSGWMTKFTSDITTRKDFYNHELGANIFTERYGFEVNARKERVDQRFKITIKHIPVN